MKKSEINFQEACGGYGVMFRLWNFDAYLALMLQTSTIFWSIRFNFLTGLTGLFFILNNTKDRHVIDCEVYVLLADLPCMNGSKRIGHCSRVARVLPSCSQGLTLV
jgi:hypothetical protein